MNTYKKGRKEFPHMSSQSQVMQQHRHFEISSDFFSSSLFQIGCFLLFYFFHFSIWLTCFPNLNTIQLDSACAIKTSWILNYEPDPIVSLIFVMWIASTNKKKQFIKECNI